MPTAYIQELHDKGQGSIKSLETKWEHAKEVAAKEGQKDNYAYITSIFKKSLGIKASVEEPIKLNAATRLSSDKENP